MTKFGYTMMCEQSRPDQLVRDVQDAEAAGFDFAVISDHYFPWLASQGHSGYAWAILGAAAQATGTIPLMTYVTCPIIRYHPAVVAQKAATVQILSGGRFRLGLGAGENLNEHVVGRGWPPTHVRHDMLREAVDIIRALFGGGLVNHHGRHFDVESAKLWDPPDTPVPIGIACSGPESCRLAGEPADLLIATQPQAALGEQFDAAGGRGKPRIGQIAVSFDRDRKAAVRRAHEQFRWFGLGWPVNSNLPGTTAFRSASRSVTPELVGRQLACGDDVGVFVEKIRAFVTAGFDEVALVQIGGDVQHDFIRWAEVELLPALRAADASD
jgi:G6PDH family F420-dependent oxidoreductase